MRAIIILIIFTAFHNIASAQMRDSISIYKWSADRRNLLLRKIDSSDFLRYKINDKYFSKFMVQDTLGISRQNWRSACLPETIFIGEYISADSIHYIDFAKVQRTPFNKKTDSYGMIGFKNTCGRLISRNQLPDIDSILVIGNPDQFKIFSCTLYIVIKEKVEVFEIKGPRLPQPVRNRIMAMSEGSSITATNVKVDGPDGIRTVDEFSYGVKD